MNIVSAQCQCFKVRQPGVEVEPAGILTHNPINASRAVEKAESGRKTWALTNTFCQQENYQSQPCEFSMLFPHLIRNYRKMSVIFLLGTINSIRTRLSLRNSRSGICLIFQNAQETFHHIFTRECSKRCHRLKVPSQK